MFNNTTEKGTNDKCIQNAEQMMPQLAEQFTNDTTPGRSVY